MWSAALFFALPIASRLLLLRKVFRARVYRYDEEVAIEPGIVGHLFQPFPISVLLKDEYRIGSLQGGITYFPFWESWALLIVEVLLWVYLISWIVGSKKTNH